MQVLKKNTKLWSCLAIFDIFLLDMWIKSHVSGLDWDGNVVNNWQKTIIMEIW